MLDLRNICLLDLKTGRPEKCPMLVNLQVDIFLKSTVHCTIKHSGLKVTDSFRISLRNIYFLENFFRFNHKMQRSIKITEERIKLVFGQNWFPPFCHRQLDTI